jgi:hypothetical protein
VRVGEEEGVREGTALMVGKGEGLRQTGFTNNPVVPQAAGQVQGVGAPDPAGQKNPTGQITAVALEDPAAQKYPALQGPSHAGATRTVVERP